MKEMNKKTKREYLKPYRCVGGFILFITIFVGAFQLALVSVELLSHAIFGESKIAHFVSEVCTYGGIIYTYYVGYRIFFKKYNRNIKCFKLSKKYKPLQVLLSTLAAFILVRFCWIIWDYVLTLLGYSIASDEEVQLHLFGIIYVTILAPIFEEIIFRSWLLNTLKKYGTIPAIVISSLTFGIFHGTVYQAIPAIFIGVILAILTLKYGSIIPAIIIHLISNTLSIVSEFILVSENFELINNIFNLIVIIFSIIILIYLVILNHKKIVSYLKEIIKSLGLLRFSISYLLFLVLYLVIIGIDLISGIIK